jgi:hypothetical protein
MALTTVNSVLAGLQYPRQIAKSATGTLVAGRPHSLHYLAGAPGAGVAPTPGIGGEVLTTLTGQIPFSNPVSGETRLAKFGGMATQAGRLLLCDRLWQNSGLDVTSTAEQTFTGSATIPARDVNGLAVGDGVYAGVEVSTVTAAGTPTLTLKYTNQAGTAGQTATNVVSTVASSIAGTFYPIGLAAGDTGIQKAQSLQLSATWTSGTIHVVLYRIICELDLQAQIPNSVDYLSSGFPKMYNNTVPFLIFVPNTTTTSIITSTVTFAQG